MPSTFMPATDVSLLNFAKHHQMAEYVSHERSVSRPPDWSKASVSEARRLGLRQASAERTKFARPQLAASSGHSHES